MLAINEERAGNHIRQLAVPPTAVEGSLVNFARGNKVKGVMFQPLTGSEEVLILARLTDANPDDSRVVILKGAARTNPDLTGGRWTKHPSAGIAPVSYENELQSVMDSWRGAFSYIEEDPANAILGLRNPQLGAIHAVHSHWSTSEGVGTIVMPTGTGKTEVMLSVLLSACCRRALVIVPTDALRSQIAEKFLTLGVLRQPGCEVLDAQARYPIVGMLEHIPRTLDEVDEVFSRCNIIVTTSAIAGQSDDAIQNRMVHHCSHLFIDEAHHAEAPTWAAFKDKFRDRRILQFTATPFREDGKPLDGQIIYKYSLKRAQQEGYFKPIRFNAVVEFNPAKSDAAIAEAAVEQLRADSDKGHILMARVETVERAKRVYELYKSYTEFKPVQLHTGIKSVKAREQARQQITSGESRIVVCVDMLGEGFDLPELKIAAFHDIRKTLAVTLQLAGRFTRSRPDLGDATFIANTADVDVQAELRKLYSRDPDWNVLLPDLSDKLIGEQVSLKEFLDGFTDFPEEFPLKTVRPAMSAVAYQTKCERWTPENFRDGIAGIDACAQVHHALNAARNTLVVVTARRQALDWSDVENVFSWEWELYVLFWSEEQKLLFINCSSNAGEYRALARAVSGDDVTLIRGQEVFRTFAGVNRLRLQNVGLTEQLGRNVRYTGRMGADVEAALTEVQKRRARRSVLAGSGFEDGLPATVGASRKGRIWSHRRENVAHLVAWCERAGKKLLDTTIDPDEVLKGTLEGKTIGERPEKMPIAIDWPEEIYKSAESTWWIELDGENLPLSEFAIELVDAAETGPLRFGIASETHRVEFALELFEDKDTPNYRFVRQGTDEAARIRRGMNAEGEDIADFFYDDPPVIWFVDGSSLEGNEHVELKVKRPPYDPAKIQAWEWAGVDIRKESQGKEKDATSIQRHVIQELLKGDYAVVVDDDGKGEVADIVAVRVVGDPSTPSSIEAELYHCKYSTGEQAGKRVKDLYEVCGQAQKCISWMRSPERQTDIFTHLLRREQQRQAAGDPTRIERGAFDELHTIREMSRLRPVRVKVFIVQPGLSKSKATNDQLELLSVTENHLMETYQLPFVVIASE